ncbi:MAG TPA: C1 family peptidase, partial [Candidatus Limnocylindrales bacterium]|nr:C1 family peptidase [Candidatus Limnocylindrales bacterium]
MLQTPADAGAYIRTTMGSLRLFGAPPERYWPFIIENINADPPAFAYAFASNFRAMSYYRYDPQGTPKAAVLQRIKTNLAAKLPAMFGFYLFPSIAGATTGKIPFPSSTERPIGGHAIVAVGYDDSVTVPSAGGRTTTGAFLIRNSWGREWGEAGYGWLPYEYLLADMATDWWSLITADWVNTGSFFIDTKFAAGGRSDSATGEPASKPKP